MLQGAADEGTQPDGVGSYFGHPAAAVGHLQVKGDEIELVNVFPVVEAGIDFNGVLVKLFGEETLLLGRAQCVLLEEIVLFHGTDFF